MNLPDFLIVGAMKCGTSTLAAQLALQSGCFITSPKEPNFFSDDDVYAKGMEWYDSLFRGAGLNDIKGEASTHYTKLPTYPHTIERISKALKQPKIVYIIRNPIKRAVSHYAHEWTMGNMSASLEQEVQSHPELVDYGRYAMQIKPFVDEFGRANVHLMSLEIMQKKPKEELERVFRFVGGSGSVEWYSEAAKVNASTERYRRLPLQELIVDHPFATKLRRAIIPKGWRELIRKSRTISKVPEMPMALRSTLESTFLEDRERLAEIFPGDPALKDCYDFSNSAR